MVYANDRLKNNADICISAIKNNHMALEHISEKLFFSNDFRKRLKSEIEPEKIFTSPYDILTRYFTDPMSIIDWKRDGTMTDLYESEPL